MWSVAKKMGYPTWPARLVKDPNFAERLRAEQVDILLNVHSLFIIHGAVVAAPRLGSFNLHPGPLPRYAGLNAVSWALYRGEKTHGVTVHKMVPEIDAGPIVFQSFFEIEDTDTALRLSHKCVKAGLELMLRLLDTATHNPEGIPFREQDLTEREYFGREVPEGGRLSWSRSARQIYDFVRACDYYPFPSPWKHPEASLAGRQVGIAKVALTGEACEVPAGTVGPVVGSGVKVASRDEWVLVHRVVVDEKYLNAVGIVRRGQNRPETLEHEQGFEPNPEPCCGL